MTHFSLEVLVLRDGAVISQMTIDGATLHLTEEHNLTAVWTLQARSLAEQLKTELYKIQDEAMDRALITQDAHGDGRKERLMVAILKPTNRVLGWLVRRLSGG